jgi:hypothetical protein
MKSDKNIAKLKKRAGDYWFFYSDHTIIVIFGWLIYIAFDYNDSESEYAAKALFFLIAATIYLVFCFFRVLLSKTLDNDMLP